VAFLNHDVDDIGKVMAEASSSRDCLAKQGGVAGCGDDDHMRHRRGLPLIARPPMITSGTWE